MSGKIIRRGSVFILAMMLLSVSLVIVSESAMAYSWSDDFPGPALNLRWTRGGVGQVSINSESNCLYATSYDGDYLEDWHGPSIRTQIPNSVDFDISAEFRCIAKEQMNRLMVRLLGESSNQLFAFGWSDVQSADNDNKAEIALYGSSFSSPIFKTESPYSYSFFLDKNISLVRSGQNLSFYIEDNDGSDILVFSGDSSQTSVYFVEVSFLKYKTECTLETLDMNSISVTTEGAGNTGLPGAPENLDISSGNEYAYLSWSPPTDSGGLPITNYKIYRGNSTGNESYLTTIANILYYNDTGLTNGQEYFYKVSALNSVGEGPAVSDSAIPSSNSTDDPPDDPVDDPIDTDDDGTGDDSDDFPTDPAASVDTDDDGMPDNWNEGYTAEDSTSDLEVDPDDDNDGIPDTEDPDDDNDGIPDTEDEDHIDTSTNDLTSWKDNFTLTSSVITLIFLLVGIIIFILFMKSGDNSKSSEDSHDDKVKDNKARKRRQR